jgi:hypothetical protein
MVLTLRLSVQYGLCGPYRTLSVQYGLCGPYRTLTDWSRKTEVESVYCAVRTKSLYKPDKFRL